MNVERVNKWLMLAANIGVIASIIFLGLEIRQNTDALYSQSRQAILNSAQLEIFEIMNNTEIVTNVIKSGQLTQDELLKIHFFLSAAVRAREYSWLQYQNQIIDEEQWNTELNVLGIILSANRTRKWWSTVGRDQFNPNFSKFVNEYLQGIPVSDEYWIRETNWDNL